MGPKAAYAAKNVFTLMFLSSCSKYFSLYLIYYISLAGPNVIKPWLLITLYTWKIVLVINIVLQTSRPLS